MINKIIKIGLIILLFTIAWSIISNTFDGDFGWHLRFGKDAANGNFQYTDSYTWGYQNHEWTNHEWGGDILFWQIYNNLGYYFLVLLTSLSVFLAFFLAQRLPNNKTTITGLAVAVIALKSIGHILVMRLAMFSFLFFFLIWSSLEKIPNRKYFYWWPIIFWIWSALHGSWTLGFITINIYFFGNLLQTILHHYKKWPAPSTWKKRNFIEVIIAQIISLLTITINPYSYKIITETFSYFTQTFYKAHITEWVPSYVFPVFWLALAISTVALTLAIYLIWYKKISIPQFLLILAFFISGFMYKRNASFIVLISVPLIISVIYYVNKKIKDTRPKSTNLLNSYPVKHLITLFGGFAILILILSYGMRVKIYDNVWGQANLLPANYMPYQAVEFLKTTTNNRPTRIFNEFAWGGYLNWKLPESLVFLDGRGTATWMSQKNTGQTMLQDYYYLKYEAGGLEKIQKNNIDYVILKSDHFASYPPPSSINKIIFGNRLNKVYEPEKTQLEKDLENSNNWKLIYNDYMANIWENLAPR